MNTKVSIWYKDNPSKLKEEQFLCDNWEFLHEKHILRIHANLKIIKIINFNEVIKMESEIINKNE